ncbi:CDK5 and ABL1 enzyme substrate 2 isoform X1 [Tachysurus ichikawai]
MKTLAASKYPYYPTIAMRTRNLSGSHWSRSLKKVHFIKNMRQYDTRGSRIVLICAKRSLCAAFSVLPYGESFYIRYHFSPRSTVHDLHDLLVPIFSLSLSLILH